MSRQRRLRGGRPGVADPVLAQDPDHAAELLECLPGRGAEQGGGRPDLLRG